MFLKNFRNYSQILSDKQCSEDSFIYIQWSISIVRYDEVCQTELLI